MTIHRLTALALAASLSVFAGSASAGSFYVATNGDDSNPGTLSQPFRTVQKCATTAASGSTCFLRTGSYYETVTPNSGITIEPYQKDVVTMDGSDPVTGWTKYKGKIWQASVTLRTDDTNQIFVGQQMMTEARWPNGDDLFHPNWASAGTGTKDKTVADSNLPHVDWTGASIFLWSGDDPWEPMTGKVTGSIAGRLTVKYDGKPSQQWISPQKGGVFYLFGTLAALDSQREWFYDPKTSTLYFWAPGGGNPAKLDVRSKTRFFAFDLSGKSNVTIRGVHLFATAINSDGGSSNDVIDGITAVYPSHYTHLKSTDGKLDSSFWWDHIFDSGLVISGTHDTVENSTISYSAGNGISLNGTHDTVKNNLIHHIDYMGSYAAGITIGASNNLIENNTIYATGRFSVYPSWQINQGIEISYNNMYEAMMMSADGGNIYIPYVDGQSDMKIHHNWFHDIEILDTPLQPIDGAPRSGVYLDGGVGGWQVYQNTIWNAHAFSFMMNDQNTAHSLNDYVHNNSIPDVNQLAEIYLQANGSCGALKVENNFVLVKPLQSGNTCHISHNNAQAAGADHLTASQVGCNFAGCTSNGPPKVCGLSVAASIGAQPYDLAVNAGQPAKFYVIANGSKKLSYQWKKNGQDIRGATDTSFSIKKTTKSDNGDAYSVQVSNSCGGITSQRAILSIE